MATGLAGAEAPEPYGLGPSDGIPSAACRDAQRGLGVVHFTKLPVTIEAVRVNATDYNGKDWDGCPFDAITDWLQEAITSGAIKPDTPGCTDYAEWKIETREGAVWAGPDDWIVRGVQGEIYPCAGEIFEQTYAPDVSAIEFAARQGDA